MKSLFKIHKLLSRERWKENTVKGPSALLNPIEAGVERGQWPATLSAAVREKVTNITSASICFSHGFKMHHFFYY